MQIRQNSDSDDKRFCTLQVVVRALPKGKPQPRLTIIFRGLGKRIAPEERAQWDPRVCVTFQQKAWADQNWCLEWAVSEFRKIVDECVPTGHRAVAILDNLHGQCTSNFKKAMAKSRVDTHFGVPGGTHLWQVVDDGIGAMIKKEMAEIVDEHLDDEVFAQEWCGGAMSASRVRVLTTQFAGEAWERCQSRLDCLQIFRNKGWAMVCGDGNDELKITGLPDYDWKSGADLDGDVDEDECESEEEESEEEVEEMVGDGDDSEDEGDSEKGDEDTASSSEEEEVDPGEWVDTDEHTGICEYTKPKPKLVIAHKFLTTVGWEVGTLVRKSSKYWLVKYPSETGLYKHELKESDYGPVWLAIKQN